jgi:hypothetical protein
VLVLAADVGPSNLYRNGVLEKTNGFEMLCFVFRPELFQTVPQARLAKLTVTGARSNLNFQHRQFPRRMGGQSFAAMLSNEIGFALIE